MRYLPSSLFLLCSSNWAYDSQSHLVLSIFANLTCSCWPLLPPCGAQYFFDLLPGMSGVLAVHNATTGWASAFDLQVPTTRRRGECHGQGKSFCLTSTTLRLRSISVPAFFNKSGTRRFKVHKSVCWGDSCHQELCIPTTAWFLPPVPLLLGLLDAARLS